MPEAKSELAADERAVLVWAAVQEEGRGRGLDGDGDGDGT